MILSARRNGLEIARLCRVTQWKSFIVPIMSRHTNNTIRRANCTAGRRPFRFHSLTTTSDPAARVRPRAKRAPRARRFPPSVPRAARRTASAEGGSSPSALGIESCAAAPRQRHIAAHLVARGACTWNSRASPGPAIRSATKGARSRRRIITHV